MRTSTSLFQVGEERQDNLTRKKIRMDPDACINELSVLKAALTLLSCPAAPCILRGRQAPPDARREEGHPDWAGAWKQPLELGVDGWRQDTVGEGGERRD